MAEYCNGESEFCPHDVHVQNGKSCKGNTVSRSLPLTRILILGPPEPLIINCEVIPQTHRLMIKKQYWSEDRNPATNSAVVFELITGGL